MAINRKGRTDRYQAAPKPSEYTCHSTGLADRIKGAIVTLALWGWLALLYSSLPPFVPLHFDAAGNPDRIVVRREVFTLPAIGLVVFLANTSLGGALYRRLPFASYVLFGGATLVQSLLLVTVWHLLVNWG